MTIQSTWLARNIRQWMTIYIWDIPSLLQFMLHYTFGHRPTTLNLMVKQKVWMCSAQSKRGGNNNWGDIEYISSFITNNTKCYSEESNVSSRSTHGIKTLDHTGCLMATKQKQRYDASQNKIKLFSVGTSVFARNYRPWQPNWIPSTIHKKRTVYDVNVGKLFWAWHRNQLRSRYTQNNLVNNMPSILLDMLLDTFELPSPSLPVQTRASRKTWQDLTKVQLHKSEESLD